MEETFDLSSTSSLSVTLISNMGENDTEIKKTSPKGTKFRYIINGQTIDKKYTIEEARWCDINKRFVKEYIHVLTCSTVKKWFGCVPSTIGKLKRIVWLIFPESIYNIKNNISPIKMWEQNNNIFCPFIFKKLEYDPVIENHQIYEYDPVIENY